MTLNFGVEMKVGDLVTLGGRRTHKLIYGTVVSKRIGNLGHTMIYKVFWQNACKEFDWLEGCGVWFTMDDLEAVCK